MMDHPVHVRAWHRFLGCLLPALLLAGGAMVGCDSVAPAPPERIVAEAFLTTGDSMPEVRLRRTRPLNAPLPTDGSGSALVDASVTLTIDGTPYPFTAVGDDGRYTAGAAVPLPPGSRFSFEAQWNGHTATAEGTLPPPVTLDSFRVSVPEAPIQAVLFDSVFVDPTQLDSLQLDSLRTGAEDGFAYPIEVQFWWTEPADRAYWIRTRLRPAIEAGSSLDDFFLRPEQVQQEADATCPAAEDCPPAVRSWIGVYGVPVEDDTAALPPHSVQLALIRGDEPYARFAATRDDPPRREPISNVDGGLGIVTGIALDTVRVEVN
ncbi:MAG: DUF4249 family protein [Bacteroidetes bacterium]|nr:DUF4249 family protein [Bacteroidota bacterium]